MMLLSQTDLVADKAIYWRSGRAVLQTRADVVFLIWKDCVAANVAGAGQGRAGFAMIWKAKLRAKMFFFGSGRIVKRDFFPLHVASFVSIS